MKAYLYKAGTILTCVAINNFEGYLTLGNKYVCSESWYEPSAGDFVVTIMADDGRLYRFPCRCFEEREAAPDNLLKHSYFEACKTDPDVFINNLKQIIAAGEEKFGVDYVSHHLEQNLNNLHLKQFGNVIPLFGPSFGPKR